MYFGQYGGIADRDDHLEAVGFGQKITIRRLVPRIFRIICCIPVGRNVSNACTRTISARLAFHDSGNSNKDVLLQKVFIQSVVIQRH